MNGFQVVVFFSSGMSTFNQSPVSCRWISGIYYYLHEDAVLQPIGPKTKRIKRENDYEASHWK